MKILFTFLLSSAYFLSGYSQITTSSKDIQFILKKALDLPTLQQYYHTDVDVRRKQVYIVEKYPINKENVKSVKKFGLPVIVFTQKKIKKENIKHYFTIDNWDQRGDSVHLQLSYPAEGLSISYIFKKKQNNWRLIYSDLKEK